MQGRVLAVLCLVSAAHGIPMLLDHMTMDPVAGLSTATGLEVDGGESVLLVLSDEPEVAESDEPEGMGSAIIVDPEDIYAGTNAPIMPGGENEDFYVGADEDEAGHHGRMALSTEGGEVMSWGVPPSGMQVFPLVDGAEPCFIEESSLTEVLEARRLQEIKGWEARKEEARKEREEEDWNRGWVTRLLDSVSSHMAGMPPLERDFA